MWNVALAGPYLAYILLRSRPEIAVATMMFSLLVFDGRSRFKVEDAYRPS
jgi:hypothetical protein